MKRVFKIGDKVRVKSKDWYDKKSNYGRNDIKCEGNTFIPDMARYCGKVVTISSRSGNNYKVIEDPRCWGWTEDMFEDEVIDQFDIFHFGKDFYVLVDLENKSIIPEIFDTIEEAKSYVEGRG